ncbi:hypothetical protein D3C77_293820 [compost metagenome]
MGLMKITGGGQLADQLEKIATFRLGPQTVPSDAPLPLYLRLGVSGPSTPAAVQVRYSGTKYPQIRRMQTLYCHSRERITF